MSGLKSGAVCQGLFGIPPILMQFLLVNFRLLIKKKLTDKFGQQFMCVDYCDGVAVCCTYLQ